MLDATDGNEFLARTADFLLAKPLQILLILLCAWIVNRLVRRAIRRFMPTARRRRLDRRPPARTDDVARPAADVQGRRRSPRCCAAWRRRSIYGIAILMVLGEIGINLGPLLAGAGIAGIAIGFGAQSLVKDFLSGVFMLVEDQYGVGDVVDLGDADRHGRGGDAADRPGCAT